MIAVIPARNEAGRVSVVVRAVLDAGLLPVVVANGCTDTTAPEAAEAGAHVLVTPRVGKGAAIRAASIEWPSAPLVVVDADLTRLTPQVLQTLAAAADSGEVARGRHPQAGRLGRHVPVWAAVLGVPMPDVHPSTLLAALAAYPARALTGLDWGRIPDHYGADLAILLDLHAQGWPIREVPAGPRAHHPGDAEHLRRCAADNLAALATRSTLWSD